MPKPPLKKNCISWEQTISKCVLIRDIIFTIQSLDPI